MKKKLLMFVLTAVMAASCVACTSKTPSNKVVESTETKKEVKAQNIKAEDLTPLADKGVISGVKDLTVAEGTKVDLNELVYMDKTIVKGVDVDDSMVDYNKAGTYEVVYTITFDGAKLRDYLKSNDLTVSFDTTGNTVVVKTTVTVTVIAKEDADAAIANGDTSVVTEETKSNVQKENKAKANDKAVESTPAPAQSNSSKKNNNSGSSNGNNGSTDKPKPHTHIWDAGSVTAQPTCTTAGTKVYHCSCGETKKESIPALGHDPITKTDRGHNVHTVIKAAWDEDIWESRYICNGCGKQFKTNLEAGEHVAAADISSPCANYHAERVKVNTIHHPEQATDEWVVDPYTVCRRCGQQL